jgi:hypothetical protein
MPRRMIALAACVPMVLSLGACGGSDQTPTDSSSPALAPVITIVATPAEAAAAPSSDPGYQFAASYTLTLTETAGVVATIRTVSANVQQSSGGVVVPPPTGLSVAFRYELQSSGNRIDGNGTATMSVSFSYTLPQPGQEALTSVTVNFSDALGRPYSQTVQVKVV